MLNNTYEYILNDMLIYSDIYKDRHKWYLSDLMVAVRITDRKYAEILIIIWRRYF